MTESSMPFAKALGGMSATRRFMVFGAAAAIVVVVGFVGRWASAPTYVTLFRDLELNEAGSVSESLGKGGIPYKLGGGGTEVLVPVSEIARARVALAKQGLPTNGRPGLELFDKASWGMTDFTQRVTYQRALEGELSRTIGGLRGIQRAQVHLVLPTASALRRLERPASASVLLSLKSGVGLSPEAVQGITYIVSNSVEQLASDNVAVMDDAGHILSIPTAGGGSIAGMTSRQLEIQRSVEQYLGEKVEGLLGTVVGNGKARAQVAAQLSFDQVDRTVDSFDPDGAVLQTEQRSEGGGAGEADASASQTVVSNAYQNSRKLEKIIGSVGSVTRLTVAVLVDEKAMQAGAAANLSLDRLESMVRNTVGADSTRGDRVSIMAVTFDTTSTPFATAGAGTPEVKADPMQMIDRLMRPLVGLVAIVALLLVAFRVVRSGGDAGAGRAAAGREAGAEEGPPNLGGNGNGARRNGADSEHRPESSAQVVRAWLAES